MANVLITGANRGIGLAFARSFAADNWRVQACCRHPDQAEALGEIAQGSAGRVRLHALEVTDDLSVTELARELAEDSIDILLNNAGVYGPRTGFGETDYAQWSRVLAVNLLGPMHMAEVFLDQLVRSKRKLIVNISSNMGSLANNDSGGAYIYRSSKAALNAVSKSLSIDLKDRGVIVVMFHPGWVRSDMGGSGASIDPEVSVAGMRAVIERLSPEDNGRFFNYDGSELPW